MQIKIKSVIFMIFGLYFPNLIPDFIPGHNSTNGYINLKSTEMKRWYATVTFDPVQTSSDLQPLLSYEIWIVPIFPKLSFTSWSSEYGALNETSIVAAINNSIDNAYLTKNGVKISNNIDKRCPFYIFTFGIWFYSGFQKD